MQNNEYRCKIAELQNLNHELKEKQIKQEFQIDEVYNDLFVKNDTLKLYDKTLEDLTKALNMEKAFDGELTDNIKKMKELVDEE